MGGVHHLVPGPALPPDVLPPGVAALRQRSRSIGPRAGEARLRRGRDQMHQPQGEQRSTAALEKATTIHATRSAALSHCSVGTGVRAGAAEVWNVLANSCCVIARSKIGDPRRPGRYSTPASLRVRRYARSELPMCVSSQPRMYPMTSLLIFREPASRRSR